MMMQENDVQKKMLSIERKYKSSADLVLITQQYNQFNQPQESQLNEGEDHSTKEEVFPIQNPIDGKRSIFINKEPRIEKLVPIGNVYRAYMNMKKFITRTSIQRSIILSGQFNANIYFKREDQQIVRSYKLRGAFNKISSMSEADRQKGIVCASAGNHAQGVSYTCNQLKIKSTIFMPTNTPQIKIGAVRSWGKEYATIQLVGDTYDECYAAAVQFCDSNKASFVHPFNDDLVIEGQATVGLEILEDIPEKSIDILIFPIGGGGLGSGLSSVFKQLSKDTLLIGCEPSGAPAAKCALDQGKPVMLNSINTFVDGAAVKTIGDKTFSILNEVLTDVCLVPEGHICTILMKLFNEEGILVEPAGALSVAVLDQIADKIKGKTVVSIISGSNNDIGRMQDIRLLSDMNQGLQYFLFINFYQKPGALKQFLTECLGPTDEITNMEYTKKHNRERGPALVGVKVKSPFDFEQIKQNMNIHHITYKFIDPDSEIFRLLL